MLYTGKIYGMQLPDEYKEFCVDHLGGNNYTRDPQYVSKYESQGARAAFHLPTIHAVALLEMIKAGHGAIGYSHDNTGDREKMLIEYDLKDGRRMTVSYSLSSGNYKAAIAEFINERVHLLAHPAISGYNNGAGLIGEALVLPFLVMPNEEKDQAYSLYQTALSFEDKAWKMLALCSNVCARINRNMNDTGSFSASNSGNIVPLREDNLKEPHYYVEEGTGEFKVFKSNISCFHTSQPLSMVTKFRVDFDVSDEEKALIPNLPDTYDIPDVAYEICTMIQSCGMRKFLLKGKSGVGKTTMAPMIAQMRGLPYRFFNCSGGTDETQLISNFIPASASSSDFQTPSFMDLINDPPTAWYKMTGEYREDVEGQEVLEKMVELSRGTAGGFKLVESAIVEACRYPSVLEIQEPSAIRNPTAIEALNSLLDGNQSITTVEGEVVKCHPETIFILTANPQYQGNKELTQAVLDRMNMIFEIGNPEAEIMAMRGMKATGFSDQTLAVKMAEIIMDIDEYCDQNGIIGGVCGPRAYENWLRHTMITGSALKSINSTVLTKAVIDKNVREEVRKACVESKLAA